MRTFLILAVTLIPSLFGCNEIKAEDVKYQPTSGEVTVISPIQEHDAPPENADAIRRTVEFFPNEIYYGDTIYLVMYDENISERTLVGYMDCDPEVISARASISSDLQDASYQWIPEYRSTENASRNIPTRDLQPGEKRALFQFYFEFPPLEDLETPFWKQLVENIPQEGLKYQFHINYAYDDAHHERHEKELVEEILIKPRPQSEMEMLNQWYNTTPKELFPLVEKNGYRKIPQNKEMFLCSSGQSDIRIGSQKYDPWMFIRTGNRKPSDPNNPTTIDGWRTLESNLTPSTLRDEIRFTRLQLEYYNVDESSSEIATNTLIKWLQEIPDVQRRMMLSSLISNEFRFTGTSLEEKNLKLIQKLYPMLDAGNQRKTYYKNQSLLFPSDIKNMRPMMETLVPTADELSVGSKELSDGFRIWDVTGDTGSMRIVAQYVERKDKDTIVLKNRERRHFQLKFSSLSKTDQQYVSEKNKTK